MFISGIADEAGQDIATQVKANKELGWSHIEVRNVNETNLTDVPDDGFDQILRAVTDAKLQISCFASRIANWAKDISDPSSFESDQEELARAIPRMKKAGTPFIRIMSYANKQNMPDAEWRDQAVERISTLARMAEDGEITLLHENCDGWGGLGPAQTLELLAAVNSPALRLVFDTGNTVPHCQDTMDYYQKVRRYIDYVHIKDARKVGGSCTFCFVGDGDARVAEIITDLKNTGYNGGFSIEPHVAAIVHERKTATAEELYSSYIEYGRRLNKIVEGIMGSQG